MKFPCFYTIVLRMTIARWIWRPRPARLVIPVFRNLLFGPQKAFLTGFLRIFFFLRFPEEFLQERGFGGGRSNSCFFPILEEFFAGIPGGQEFLYLLRIPQESGGFWRSPSGSF